MERVDGEVEERAPLLHAVLSAACIKANSQANGPQKNFGAIAMAGSTQPQQVHDCSPVPDHQFLVTFKLAGMFMSLGILTLYVVNW